MLYLLITTNTHQQTFCKCHIQSKQPYLFFSLSLVFKTVQYKQITMDKEQDQDMRHKPNLNLPPPQMCFCATAQTHSNVFSWQFSFEDVDVELRQREREHLHSRSGDVQCVKLRSGAAGVYSHLPLTDTHLPVSRKTHGFLCLLSLTA